MWCPMKGYYSVESSIWCFGLMVFVLLWIVIVPVVITSRLEKIIKLLQDKK